MYTVYEINLETYSERFNVACKVSNMYELLAHFFDTETVWVRQLGEHRFVARVVTRLAEFEAIDRAHALSATLLQDCVALARINLRDSLAGSIEKGWLVGPYAREWGEFKEEYFERFTK